MKRYGNLWPQIVNFENLLWAAQLAQRGKRFRPYVLDFNHNLEQELFQLLSELRTQTYQPGSYKTFRIRDPKPRFISAAPYRDRVVHHALCNIITPLLERSLIHDTYANRLGYGTHRALKRFAQFSRSSQYILQCDIQKYFPSIDHKILKALVRRKIKCPGTLWLIDLIIDASNPQEPMIVYFPGDDLLTPVQRRRGLPIGNLTSQFFANYYLNGFDHYLKESLQFKKYLRYVDDFCLFEDDPSRLKDAQSLIEQYLTQLRLKLHPTKSQLFETRYGANFVGFRALPDRIRVRADNLYRARKRCKYLQKEYSRGNIPLEDLVQRIQSWEAHLKHADTHRLRRKLFNELIFRKSCYSDEG